MASRRHGRPVPPCLVLAAALWALRPETRDGPPPGGDDRTRGFALPAPQVLHGESATGLLTRRPAATLLAEPHASRIPRPSGAAVAAKTLTYTFEAVGIAALLNSALRRWVLPAKEAPQGEQAWSPRRFWTAINVGNHAIYAILFVIRSLFYRGVGGGDRPFYFESYFLGYLCGPAMFLPRLLGWNGGEYNQKAVLSWMASMNSADGGVFPAWVTCCINNPVFMYWYQIAEGTFHFMIVLGGLRAFFPKLWPPKEGDRSLSLFRWGLWLELLIMDFAYVVAYTCLPALGVPGHWGLTTIMMLIHHVNVLPDVVCAWHEWKAAKAAKSEKGLLLVGN